MSETILCSYCLKPTAVSRIQMDHIVPRSKGGLDTADNLTPACPSCNATKRARSLFEFAFGVGTPDLTSERAIIRASQDEAITLIRREIEDIDVDLMVKRETLLNTASEIGRLETRRRRMNRLYAMAGGEA